MSDRGIIGELNRRIEAARAEAEALRAENEQLRTALRELLAALNSQGPAWGVHFRHPSAESEEELRRSFARTEAAAKAARALLAEPTDRQEPA